MTHDWARFSIRTASFLALVSLLTGAGGTAWAQTPLRSVLHSSGFSAPIAFVQDPTDRTVQFVVEQGGRVRTVRNGAALSQPFLDVSSQVSNASEQGLLGLAFAPDYVTTRRFYINFTNAAGHTVIARFKRSGSDPLVADASSRFDLKWNGSGGPAYIAQPYANHNGGHLAFGPDGYLYIGTGDGGAGDDPLNRSQTASELLGKMLRIDVSVSDGDAIGYRIPSDNPFLGAGQAGTRPEIWSFGHRNPWRYSFDDPSRGGTGALVMGDVGQDQWEEVNYEPANRGGRNYGWRYREGAHDHLTNALVAFFPLVDPIHEYDHTVGKAITGGFVYRGSALGPEYRGRYFFADYVRGRVWSVALTINSGTGEAQASNLVEHTSALGGVSLGNISSFGVDADGEMYIVSLSTGKIFKIASTGIFQRIPGDVDGDGKSDVTIYRPSSGEWWVLRSGGNFATYSTYGWGLAGDVPEPGDYDGDGKVDLAIYRPTTSQWWILWSSTNFATYSVYGWGLTGDIPVPSDYDGDGKTDIAIYRPTTAGWWVLKSSTGFSTYSTYGWGLAGDTPVVGDYDGDGKSDPAIYRPSTNDWWILRSSNNYGAVDRYTWGLSGDVPVAADFDGDGKTDVAIYRPTTGGWWILKSSTGFGTYSTYGWGLSGDVPVLGDFDGDGKTDVAIYRPTTGGWWILKSSTNFGTYSTYGWGLAGDVPLFRRP